MKAAFALFLVLVLIVAALQADAKSMNLRGHRLAYASMGRKAVAGSSGNTDAQTEPQREKNAGFNNYSSTPANSSGDGTHHVITGP
ncbi:hypothetical protein NL676_020624 [Syzygium grande]|nr:hypothetical protein NL676_020624 [Syzygium grande]